MTARPITTQDLAGTVLLLEPVAKDVLDAAHARVADILAGGGTPWAITRHGALHGYYNYQTYNKVVAVVEAPTKRKAQAAFRKIRKGFGETVKFGRFAHDAVDLTDEFYKNDEIGVVPLKDEGTGEEFGHMFQIVYKFRNVVRR